MLDWHRVKRTRAGAWALVLLPVVLPGQGSPSGGRTDEGQPGRAFSSPDGRRVVRLSLESATEKTLEKFGYDRATREIWRTLGPSLEIELSRVHGDREILIRSFTGSAGAGAKARYRVLWDNLSRRFLVLCSEAPRPSVYRDYVPPLWITGESIAFFFDRTTERYSPVHRFTAAEWDASAFSGSSENVLLPVVFVDPLGPESASRRARTGEIRLQPFRAPTKERILNFTIHPNTQNLRAGGTGLSAMPPVRSSSSSPDGRFTAKLAGERDLMILLSEGDRYRDELWILLYPIPAANQRLMWPAGSDWRLLWSRDSRYLLIVTPDAPAKGFDRLPDGTALFLLFDTLEWGGVLGPRREQLLGIDVPGLIDGRGGQIARE